LGWRIDFSLLLNVFAGKQNVIDSGSGNLFEGELFRFLIYTLIETTLASVLGWILIKCFGGNQWLLKSLMGNNIWFKLFTGTTLSREQKLELANILVEVLVETKESSVIYSGLLKSYEILDNTDGLAYVVLTGTFRRDLRKAQLVSKDLEGARIITSSSYDIDYGSIIPIRGHIFTISGKDIVNINVTYMKQVIDPATNRETLEPIEFG
jgi:hypothetical protein